LSELANPSSVGYGSLILQVKCLISAGLNLQELGSLVIFSLCRALTCSFSVWMIVSIIWLLVFLIRLIVGFSNGCGL